jgi:hypothetical protein
MLRFAFFFVPLMTGWLVVASWFVLRARGAHRWLPNCARATVGNASVSLDRDVHLLLCIADHFEPWENQRVSAETARARVEYWVREYPRRMSPFRDSDDRPPRHTFFFPVEDYDCDQVALLAQLCSAGYGEVEVHLHHENDTAESLRSKLSGFRDTLAHRHGLLSRHIHTGALVYGFVHGNWALDNSHPDGAACGVNNELDVLRETGCYADFTLPSAPSPTQTRKVNSLYYALDDPRAPKSHDWGVDVGCGSAPAGSLMIIQGPLLLNWQHRRRWLLPRLENACIQASQPPSLDRLQLWLKARIRVPSRPDWFFVKLHTHGAAEDQREAVIGEPMLTFHRDLARLAADNPHFHFHYVSAREMYNLIRAAESGWQGTVAEARDFELARNTIATSAGATNT